MAPDKSLTEYERRRLENIKRNEEMMASLKLHARSLALSPSSKRQRIEARKPKSETPVAISLRARQSPPPLPESTPRQLGPLSMRKVYLGKSSDESLINLIRSEAGRVPAMIAGEVRTGNRIGNLSFWDVDCGKEDGNGVYLYRPHFGPVLGISIQPSAMSKVFTSSYDGQIRLMDVEKELFDVLYSSDEYIFSLFQRPNDVNSLYFSEASGDLYVFDIRARQSSSSWILHTERINTIDINPENTNLMATSSTDGTACIWDLRSNSADGSNCLKKIDHKRACHSAYFSPSGNCLATTRAIWGWDDSHVFIGSMTRGVDVISTTDGRTVTLESSNMTAIPCRSAAHPFKAGTLATTTSGGHVYLWTSKREHEGGTQSRNRGFSDVVDEVEMWVECWSSSCFSCAGMSSTRRRPTLWSRARLARRSDSAQRLPFLYAFYTEDGVDQITISIGFGLLSFGKHGGN
ncbi:hypothetical protein Sjap_010988 [Stephania japonica]|uniref:WD repeat-containing protein 76 n=1 Tax=Stephania japonica TaxID=461633 RepID=A0AAP0JCH8_9MAGN